MSLFTVGASSSAQPAPSVDLWAGVEEMVVVGDTRIEPLLEQSTSVISFDSKEILAKGIANVGDLAEFTPNLEIQSSFGASSPELFIRGVGLRDSNSNAASAVAVISDGVYFNSATAQLAQLFDVKNVSVLRGPQGSEYGRNASAGVILLDSNRPSGETGARLSLSYGRFNELDLEGYVETAMIPDRLAVRVSAKHSRRDPLGHNRCGGGPPFDLQRTATVTLQRAYVVSCDESRFNLALGGNSFPNPESRVNDRDNWAMRAQALYTHSDELNVLFNLHGGQNRSLAPSFQHFGNAPPAVPPVTDERNLVRNLFRDTDNYFDPDRCRRFDMDGTRCLANTLGEDRGDPFSGDYSATPPEDLDQIGAIVRVERSFEAWSLTSVTSYERTEREAGLDIDATPFILAERAVEDTSWQIMQDLHLTWTRPERLELTLGAFLIHAQLDANNRVLTRTTSSFLNRLGQDFEESTDYLGLFGVGRFELTELFSVTIGLRMNVERKDFSIVATNSVIVNDEVVGTTTPGIGLLIGTEESLDVVPTGDLILEYSATEDVDLYGKFVRGYKGRHFNAGGTLPESSIFPAQPEFVNSLELGFGARLLDEILSWNGAAFLYLYEDQQVFQLRTANASPPINQLINADDSRVFGIETDLRLDWEGVHFFGAFGWTHAEYSNFVNRIETVRAGPDGLPVTETSIEDYSGNRLVLAPEFSFSGGIYYDWEIEGFGTITPRFDARFKDRVFTTPRNNPVLGDNERWLFDARLDYQDPNGWLTAGVWIRNLTDEIYRNTVVGDVERRRTAVAVADPRTYGFSTTVTF